MLVAQFRNCCVNHNQLGLKCSQLHLFWWLSSLYWEVRFRKNISKFLHNDVKKIFPRISIRSNFCLLRISALPPERRTRKQKTDRKEASTFREQLFSRKLPFCPYKQKLSVAKKNVRQNLKELFYLGSEMSKGFSFQAHLLKVY